MSRNLAAAQTVAVVEAGGRTVSLGDILGPAVRAAPDELFSDDRFHPSAAGYAGPRRCCSVCLAALGLIDAGPLLRFAAPGAAGRSRAATGGRAPRYRGRPTEIRGETVGRRGRWAGSCVAGPRPSAAPDLEAVTATTEPDAPGAGGTIGACPRPKPSSSRPPARPIGRAFKGSLEGDAPRRPGRAHRAAPRSTRSRSSTRTTIDDLLLGCGLPGGEQGFNMARVVAVLLGLRQAARRDDHPVLLVLAADHADGVARDQGRRGRRVHLGRGRDGDPVRQWAAPTPAGHAEPDVREARGPQRPRRAAGGATWHDPREDGLLPDVYIAMGQTAENVAELERHHPRGAWTSSAFRSQNLAEKAIANGFFEREITPVTLPRRQLVVSRRRPAARRHHRGVSPRSKPVFRPDGTRHRGQLLPAQRRRRRAWWS